MNDVFSPSEIEEQRENNPLIFFKRGLSFTPANSERVRFLHGGCTIQLVVSFLVNLMQEDLVHRQFIIKYKYIKIHPPGLATRCV